MVELTPEQQADLTRQVRAKRAALRRYVLLVGVGLVLLAVLGVPLLAVAGLAVLHLGAAAFMRNFFEKQATAAEAHGWRRE